MAIQWHDTYIFYRIRCSLLLCCSSVINGSVTVEPPCRSNKVFVFTLPDSIYTKSLCAQCTSLPVENSIKALPKATFLIHNLHFIKSRAWRSIDVFRFIRLMNPFQLNIFQINEYNCNLHEHRKLCNKGDR